jgi:predicted RNA methylase
MFIFLLIFLTIIVIVPAVFLYSLLVGLFFYAPWVPLNRKEVERILNLAEIRSNDILYDLGSGDGRVIIAAAKKYKIKTIGIEIAWPLVFWSRLKIKFNKLSHLAEVRFGNLYQTDLSQATIVVFYLLPAAVEKLIPKLKKELKPGTKIISAAFKINNWPALKIDRPTAKDMPIYLYKL